MLTDFRNAALRAGIAITLSAVWSLVGQFLFVPLRSSLDLIGTTAFFLLILALELPTPAFLLLLYRTGLRPTPSRTLQLLITALTAILGFSLLVFIRNGWRTGIIPDGRGLALSAKFGAWFLVSPGSPLWTAIHVVSTALQFVSRLLTILFFVVFAKQIAPPAVSERAATRQVKKAAVIAIAARVLMMGVSVLSYLIYAYSARTYGKPGTTPGGLPLLPDLLFGLPVLILPWIVYRGIRNLPVSGELTSA